MWLCLWCCWVVSAGVVVYVWVCLFALCDDLCLIIDCDWIRFEFVLTRAVVVVWRFGCLVGITFIYFVLEWYCLQNIVDCDGWLIVVYVSFELFVFIVASVIIVLLLSLYLWWCLFRCFKCVYWFVVCFAFDCCWRDFLLGFAIMFL